MLYRNNGRPPELHNDLCDVGVYDVEQSIRSAAPPSRDRRERDSVNVSAATAPDRRLLSPAAMFSSTTADQYEQFIRLQQLLMHMQTGMLLQPSDNGAQVRNVFTLLQFKVQQTDDINVVTRNLFRGCFIPFSFPFTLSSPSPSLSPGLEMAPQIQLRGLRERC